jgi:molecular chaperone DnaJ
VTVEVVVPAELSTEAKAALEAYRSARGDQDPRSGLFEAGV